MGIKIDNISDSNKTIIFLEQIKIGFEQVADAPEVTDHSDRIAVKGLQFAGQHAVERANRTFNDHIPPQHDSGGCEQCEFDLLLQLEAHGQRAHDVTVVTLRRHQNGVVVPLVPQPEPGCRPASVHRNARRTHPIVGGIQFQRYRHAIFQNHRVCIGMRVGVMHDMQETGSAWRCHDVVGRIRQIDSAVECCPCSLPETFTESAGCRASLHRVSRSLQSQSTCGVVQPAFRGTDGSRHRHGTFRSAHIAVGHHRHGRDH